MANFRQSITVADSAGGNGNFPGASVCRWMAGSISFTSRASFEGATLTLQMGLDGSSFVSLTEGIFTAPNTDFGLPLPVMPMSGGWCQVRAVRLRISM